VGRGRSFENVSFQMERVGYCFVFDKDVTFLLLLSCESGTIRARNVKRKVFMKMNSFALHPALLYFPSDDHFEPLESVYIEVRRSFTRLLLPRVSSP